MSMDQALRELQECALKRGWFDSVTLKMTASRWLAEYTLGPPVRKLFASDEDPEVAVSKLLDKVREFEEAERLRARA